MTINRPIAVALAAMAGLLLFCANHQWAA